MTDDFKRLCKHAERFGTELVYETAEAYDRELISFPVPLGAKELGYLARRLRAISPKWRLDAKQQRRLFDRLAETGASDGEIATSCGTTTRTVRTWRSEGAEPLVQAVESVVN